MNTTLTKLLQHRAISSISHYQNFTINLLSEKPIRGFPSTIKLYLGSDWFLNGKDWWTDFIMKFPIDTSGMPFPYEPVKAFALFLLDAEILDVELSDDNSLDLHFSNNYILHIPGKISYPEVSWMNEPEYEKSWLIGAAEDSEYEDLEVSCDGNGKLSVKGIECLLR